MGTLTDNVTAGRASPGLILAVAGWIRYVGGFDEKGAAIDVKDPLAADLADRAARGVDDVLGQRMIFNSDLHKAISEPDREAHARRVATSARRVMEELS